MTVYTFRVRLLPNPPLQFDPDEPVWRDVELDGSHTLVAFHEAIFDAFDRYDLHGYEFVTRDAAGDPVRRFLDPLMYDDESAGAGADDDALVDFLEEALPDDVPDEATDAVEGLGGDRAPELNAAETTVGDLDLDEGATLSYTFDFGDGWEHAVELRATREGSLDGDPVVVDEAGAAPPQYPDRDG